ncbi:hypothetical protein [Oceanobacillus locisalsi]|uniref:ABC transporter ATPase n=1 Tax=Oceanobacillus locisalsi TaxID=546107 RepID=A0ABW3NNB3_9BACI
MLLNKLKEEDFTVLKGSLESGRQSPNSLGGMLILAIFLQSLLFIVIYMVGGDRSSFPNKDILFMVHLVVTIVVIVLSIVYAIPYIYMKYQKTQYMLTIIVSQNLFGISFYICALLFIGKNRDITTNSLMMFTYVTLIIGGLIFISTCIRFYILLRKGSYRTGTKKDRLRGKFEKKSYLPMVIIGSIGLVFILQYLVRTFGLEGIDTIVMMTLFISLFYAMLFVLPEQLVILYCKYRFDSFNFKEDGTLKPMGNDRKDA